MVLYNNGSITGSVVGGNHNTVNNFSFEQKEDLSQLLSQIQSVVDRLEISREQREEAKEYINIIAEETTQRTPKKSIIKDALDGLKKFATNDTLWELIEKLASVIGNFI